MTRKLRLYVWEDVLTDWTSGVMFALATSPEKARAAILAATGGYEGGSVGAGLSREPDVYETAVGFAVWGGG